MKLLKEATAFYPEYLRAHHQIINQVLHFTGATSFFVCLAMFFITWQWWLLPLAVFCGYFFPGIGHRFFERNQSFRTTKPVLCVVCAFWLYRDTLMLRVRKKMQEAAAAA